MKHLRRVSVVREPAAGVSSRPHAGTGPRVADAKGDFFSAVWSAWNDYVYQKKNEVYL